MSTYPIVLAERLAPPAVNLSLQLQPATVPAITIPASLPAAPFLTVIGNDSSGQFSALWSGWSGGASQDRLGRPAVFVIFSDIVDIDRNVHLALPNTTFVKFGVGGDLSIADISIPAGQWWGYANIYEGDGTLIDPTPYPSNVGSVLVTATSDGYDAVTATLSTITPFTNQLSARYDYSSQNGLGSGNAGGDSQIAPFWQTAISLAFLNRCTLFFNIDGIVPHFQAGLGGNDPFIYWDVVASAGSSAIYTVVLGQQGAAFGLSPSSQPTGGNCMVTWIRAPATSGDTITVNVTVNGILNPTIGGNTFPVVFTFA